MSTPNLDALILDTLTLTALSTERLMRLQADISDEIERRYREAKREQNKRADELRQLAGQS